ncbi:hypothetical protein D9M72_470880 [compost metagenome]
MTLTDSASSEATVPTVSPMHTMSPRRSAREYTTTMPLISWLTTLAEPSVTIKPSSTDRPLNTSLSEPGIYG